MKKRKASLSFIIATLVVGLVTLFLLWSTFFFLSLYVSSMKQAAKTSSEQAVVQASNAISNYIGDMQEIMSLIEQKLTENGRETEQTMEMLCSVRSDLVAIYIYNDRGELLDSHTGTHELKEHYLKDLSYISLDSYRSGVLYLSEPHVESLLQDYYPWVVSVLQEITGADGRKVRVVIDIRFSKISDYVDNVGIGQHGYCFITDSNGEIIYHPQQQLLYSGLKTESAENFDLSSDGSFETDELIWSVRSLDNCDWKVVGVSYISEMVTAKEMELLGNICVMLTIIMGLTMIVSFLVSRLVTKPIQRLIRAMQEFEKDAAGYVYRPVEGATEIEALSQSYEHMVGKIQNLMKQVRQEEISLRKTELKALQAQINPHFLYNTLDAIGWLCEEERCRDAVEMVNALAKLFRISISKGHELITIEKEVEHAGSYLKIQNFRYKNQFSYDFQIEEECLRYYCNKITLQPIIENAIYHGLDRMVDEGHIQIRIYSEGEDVIFRVEDNGVGMSEEQCRSILHKEPGDNSGIGIKNVNDRIKIYFGKEYGLSIESELDEGTTVIIRMPKVEENAAAGWEKV